MTETTTETRSLVERLEEAVAKQREADNRAANEQIEAEEAQLLKALDATGIVPDAEPGDLTMVWVNGRHMPAVPIIRPDEETGGTFEWGLVGPAGERDVRVYPRCPFCGEYFTGSFGPNYDGTARYMSYLAAIVTGDARETHNCAASIEAHRPDRQMQEHEAALIDAIRSFVQAETYREA